MMDNNMTAKELRANDTQQGKGGRWALLKS
jgi:hypothetical protein